MTEKKANSAKIAEKSGKKPFALIPWSRIIAALILLANPNSGLVDVLPDFLAYLLLVSALSHIAAIDSRFDEARNLFKKLSLISFLRFFALFFTMGMLPPIEQPTSLLMFSFAFDVLEIIFVLPAVNRIFDGILYISERCDGEAPYLPAGRRTVTDRTKRTVLFFVIAKAVCGTLPEFASLRGGEFDEGFFAETYMFVGLFRLFGAAVALLCGIFFLIDSVRYVNLLKTDKNVYERLKEKLRDEKDGRGNYLVSKAFGVSFILFFLSGIFAFDFELDGINVLPDFVSAILLICGIYNLRGYMNAKGLKACFASASSYLLFSVPRIVFELIFRQRFYFEAVSVDPKTYDMYVILCVSCALCEICFVVSFILMYVFCIGHMAKYYAGVNLRESETFDPYRRKNEIRTRIHKKLKTSSVLAAVSAIVSTLSVSLAPITGIFNFVGVIAGAAHIVCMYVSLETVKDSL